MVRAFPGEVTVVAVARMTNLARALREAPEIAGMVKQVIRQTGCTVGLTSTSGVYVNDILVSEGDATGPRSARLVPMIRPAA